MKNQPVLPRSEVYIISKQNKGEFIFHKIYKITRDEPLIVDTYATYANGTFRLRNSKLSSLETRRNLLGKKSFKGALIVNDLRSIENYRNYT